LSSATCLAKVAFSSSGVIDQSFLVELLAVLGAVPRDLTWR
jgi:hypothetical protein